jgi:hypothetical protein
MEFRCMHRKTYCTQLCDDHKTDGNWAECPRLKTDFNYDLNSECVSCAGMTIPERAAQRKADAERWEEAERKLEAENKAELERRAEAHRKMRS